MDTIGQRLVEHGRKQGGGSASAGAGPDGATMTSSGVRAGETYMVALDAGGSYRVPVGRDEVIATMFLCSHCEAIHLELDVEGDGDRREPIRLQASLELEPWKLKVMGADRLPAHIDSDALSAALRVHHEALAARVKRLSQRRKRDHWREQDLSFFEPGILVPYKLVFPADFDLIEEIDGQRIWFDDYHCMTVGCTCTTATVHVGIPGGGGKLATELGKAEIDLRAARSQPEGDAAAVRLLQRWLAMQGNREELGRRRAEIRRIAPAVAKKLGRPTGARVTKVGRNDPCPCGSGKKHKRCCLP